MKIRYTAILFVICLLLSAYVYFYEMKTNKNVIDTSKIIITKIKPSSITKCEFIFPVKTNEHIISIERISDNAFMIIKPIKARADSAQIEQILGSLCSMKATRSLNIIENDKNLSIYGLDKPRAIVKLWQKEKGREIKLIFGKSNKISYSVYIRKEAETKIYTVGDYIFTSFYLKLNNFREQTLLPKRLIEPNNLSFHFKNNSIHLIKKDFNWKMMKPYSYPASNSAVNKLIDTLKAIRINSFIDENNEKAQKSLKIPWLVVTISYKEKNKSDVISIAPYGPNEKNRYAHFKDDSFPVLISLEHITQLAVKPQSLLSKKILEDSLYDYKQLIMTKGKKSLEFVRGDNQQWNFHDLNSKNQGEIKNLDKQIDNFLELLIDIKAVNVYCDEQPKNTIDIKDLFSLTLFTKEKKVILRFQKKDTTKKLFIITRKPEKSFIGITETDYSILSKKVGAFLGNTNKEKPEDAQMSHVK